MTKLIAETYSEFLAEGKKVSLPKEAEAYFKKTGYKYRKVKDKFAVSNSSLEYDERSDSGYMEKEEINKDLNKFPNIKSHIDGHIVMFEITESYQEDLNEDRQDNFKKVLKDLYTKSNGEIKDSLELSIMALGTSMSMAMWKAEEINKELKDKKLTKAVDAFKPDFKPKELTSKWEDIIRNNFKGKI